MNEITSIHLGRQSFTIAVDAHHELKNYLGAVKKRVEDQEVINEIELRMAELLTERGITIDKVILPSDIDFLKVQLGSPKDFTDDSKTTTGADYERTGTKRLFRDTDTAMVAGVASGLARYFGIDATLIRILFVIAVFATFGWGILLYIVLWLIVPEAKTSSDRLQMAGRPVNVDSLRELVERTDIKGAARRANASLAGPINTLFGCLLKLAGLIFILSGLSVLLGLIAAVLYFSFSHGAWARINVFPAGFLFPVGFRENLLVYIVASVAALIALFIILIGVAMFRRKWPLRPWVTGAVVGLAFIGLIVGGVLATDVYPDIRDRYQANVHTSIRSTLPFTAVTISGPADISFQPSSTFAVGVTYFDHPNLHELKTTVQNKTLTVDTNRFDQQRNCRMFCFPDTHNLELTIYAPNALQLADQFASKPSLPPLVPGPYPSDVKIDLGN